MLQNGNVCLEVTFSSTGEVSGVPPTDPAVFSPRGACKPHPKCAWGWAQEAESPADGLITFTFFVTK